MLRCPLPDPGAHRDADLVECRSIDLLANPLGNLSRNRYWRLRKNDQKFIASNASCEINLSHMALNGFGNHLQDAIPSRMSIAIIDIFKVIQIEEDHG